MKTNKRYRRYGVYFEPEVIGKARSEAERRGISLNSLFRSALCKELAINPPEVRGYRVQKVKATA